MTPFKYLKRLNHHMKFSHEDTVFLIVGFGGMLSGALLALTFILLVQAAF